MLDRSRRTAQATDRVRWHNAAGRARRVYVGVAIPRGERTLDAGYELKVR